VKGFYTCRCRSLGIYPCKLDDHFSELTVAIVPIMVEYEEKMKQVVNKKISELMQAHKLEEALEVTKKAIEFEKQLT